MSYPHYSSHNHGHIRQNQRVEQKVIQDQNFSNEIFFGILSTIQSLQLHHQGKINQYGNKMFKTYDRVDYRTKNQRELKSQLQTQILLFKASLMVFKQENKQTTWSLPNKFNLHQAEMFLMSAIQTFGKFNDYQSQKLTIDVGKLLNGNLDSLYADNVNLKVDYSQEERKNHKKNIASNGMFAGEQMDKRQEQVKNCQDISDLPVHLNKDSYLFSQSFKDKKYQNEIQGGNCEIKMQIQHETKEGKNQCSYLVFSQLQDAKRILRKQYNYKTLNNYYCRLFLDQSQFKQKIKGLQSRFKYILRVKLNKNRDIENTYGEVQTFKKN